MILICCFTLIPHVMLFRLSKAPRAVVVDLDGTLIECDTFRQYSIDILRHLAARREWRVLMTLGTIILRLVFGSISRREFKRLMLITTEPYADEDFLTEFSFKMYRRRNPKVMDVIRYYQDRDYLVAVATSAPDNYAKRVASLLHIEHCIATPATVTGSWVDLEGDDKAAAVNAFLAARDGELATVLTDACDDLPLLILNRGRNILVSPDQKTLERLERARIAHETIDKSLISWTACPVSL